MNPPKDGQRGPDLLLKALGHTLWLWVYVIFVVVFSRACRPGGEDGQSCGWRHCCRLSRAGNKVGPARIDRAGGMLCRTSVALGALDLLRGPGEVIVILFLCQRDMA